MVEAIVTSIVITSIIVWLCCYYSYAKPFHYQFTTPKEVRRYLRACEEFLFPYSSQTEARVLFKDAKNQIVSDYNTYASYKSKYNNSYKKASNEFYKYYIELFENDGHYYNHYAWAALYFRLNLSIPRSMNISLSEINSRYKNDFIKYLDEIQLRAIKANGEFCPMSFVEKFYTDADIKKLERTGSLI